jgi:hypothetical protein
MIDLCHTKRDRKSHHHILQIFFLMLIGWRRYEWKTIFRDLCCIKQLLRQFEFTEYHILTFLMVIIRFHTKTYWGSRELYAYKYIINTHTKRDRKSHHHILQIFFLMLIGWRRYEWKNRWRQNVAFENCRWSHLTFNPNILMLIPFICRYLSIIYREGLAWTLCIQIYNKHNIW